MVKTEKKMVKTEKKKQQEVIATIPDLPKAKMSYYSGAKCKLLTTARSEEEAKAKAWFLMEEMKICSDFGVKIVENLEPKFGLGKWELHMPEQAFEYSLEKARTAVDDFWRGWEAHKKFTK